MPHRAPSVPVAHGSAIAPAGLTAPGRTSLLSQRLVALSIAFALLVNFPLLALWDHPAQVLGLPLFPLALFGLWGVFIAALAWLLERQAEPA